MGKTGVVATKRETVEWGVRHDLRGGHAKQGDRHCSKHHASLGKHPREVPSPWLGLVLTSTFVGKGGFVKWPYNSGEVDG